MNGKKPHLSHTFLLELVLSILFFAVIAAVCVEVFVKAHLYTRQAEQLNHAALEAASMAELVRASDSLEEAVKLVKAQYPSVELTEKSSLSAAVSTHFDKAYESSPLTEDGYTLRGDISQSGDLLSAHITYYENSTDTIVYSLTAEHHVQEVQHEE